MARDQDAQRIQIKSKRYVVRIAKGLAEDSLESHKERWQKKVEAVFKKVRAEISPTLMKMSVCKSQKLGKSQAEQKPGATREQTVAGSLRTGLGRVSFQGATAGPTLCFSNRLTYYKC